ncbi:MAG: ankyrin repeat domain-containing protein [Woeseiaceae bacterium]
MSNKPVLLLLLALVIGFYFYHQFANPYRKFSSANYWKSATLAQVAEIPEEALEPGNKHGSVLMFAAGFVDDPEILRALIKRGSSISEQDSLYGTPLSSAATLNGEPRIIDFLVDAGADVNRKLFGNATPLMNAAQYNANPEVIRQLIRHGADIHAKDDTGATALVYAVRHNTVAEITRALIEAGANKEVVLKSGDSLSEIARENDNAEIRNLLGK